MSNCQGKHNVHSLFNRIIPWLVWSTVAMYYFYEICLRMLPGIMTTHYMQNFHIDATHLGIFTALYYWAYVLMQIPSGIIVDRYSVRRALVAAALVCLTGFCLVHSTSVLLIAEVGRFLIGLGSAFAYVSCLKVASLWLPAKSFGFASCLLDSIGMGGAIFTEIVLVRMNVHMGHRITLWFLFLLGAAIVLLISIFLKEAPRFAKIEKKRKRRKTQEPILQTLSTILSNKKVIIIGIIGCLYYIPSSVIGDIWGMPYLESVYHFSKSSTSLIMAAFFIGWAVFGPFIGMYSDKTQCRFKPIFVSLLVLTAITSLIVYLPMMTTATISLPLMIALFTIIGMATGAHPLMFAMAKEYFPNRYAGTIVATTNMLIMLGGLIFQPLIGYLLDLSHGTKLNVYSHYNAHDFNMAFTIIPVLLIIATAMTAFIKNKKDVKVNQQHSTQENTPITCLMSTEPL